ncbi:MAG: hypothetical protein II304_14065 [Bacteroidales bacterium]|nr:hypothetical protein [Bacteroidales bacterium]
MAKKHFLSFLTLILLSISAFAQTATQPQGQGTEQNPYLISKASEFLWITNDNDAYYVQTANITNLGDFTQTKAIIQNFSGTYDGGGYSITYSATFTSNANNTPLGLFGTVTGTIKNLNVVNSSIGASGNKTANIGLLCGHLNGSNALISNCNINGGGIIAVNFSDEMRARVSTGSLVGKASGNSKIEYCSSSCDVAGYGYVGGIVGQLEGSGVYGCSFMGDVSAAHNGGGFWDWIGGLVGSGRGAYAGGIVGFADDSSTINLCYANADVSSNTTGDYGDESASGIANGNESGGRPTVSNSYAEGSVTGSNSSPITNSNNNSNNYSSTSSTSSNPCETNQTVVTNLNNNNTDPNILFALDAGCNVIMLINEVSSACESPTSLTISKDNKTITASWTSANANNTISENKWNWVIKGGEIAEGDSIWGTTTSIPITQTLAPSPSEYTITIYTDCSEYKSGLLSNSVSKTFTIDCPFPTNIQFPEITYNSFTVSWNTIADCQLLVNGVVYNIYDDITGATNLSQKVTGLSADQNYEVTIKVKCGDDYAGAITTPVGTEQEPCYPVTNLSVSNIGINTATITWDSQSSLENLSYQISLQGNTPKIQTTRTITYTNLLPNTFYTVEVREQCGEGWSDARTITFKTKSDQFATVKTGAFNLASTWQDGRVPSGDFGHITINEGHIVTINHTLILKNNCQIENNGILVIEGELINLTDNNVGGIVEVSTPILENGKWAFVGAPFEPYKLKAIKPLQKDVSVSLFNYSSNNWSEEWETYETEVGTGDGYLAWPFYGGTITYTTYGELYVWNNDSTSGSIGSYDYNEDPVYSLNNEDSITIAKPVTGSASSGRWIALSNPYTAKLNVAKFLEDNSSKIQGGCVYKLTNNVSSGSQQYSNPSVLGITDGFFVNLKDGQNSVTFKKTQLVNYPSDYREPLSLKNIELSLLDGKRQSKIYFVHNEKAEQHYDVYDANKLFALSDVVEPYFVKDGIALVKEEVKELPYTAQMNVRSADTATVTFRADNIPEGYKVFLIDNGQDIKLNNGTEYTVHLEEGENVDRFQLLVKKQEKLERIKSNEVVITNQNREVTIKSEITNLKIEVYNTVGQKVFETTNYNFTLNEVPAGAYFVKAFFNRVAETAKIVVE